MEDKMILLTGHGSFANNLCEEYKAEVVSLRQHKCDGLAADIIIHNATNMHPKTDKEALIDNILPFIKLLINIKKSDRLVLLSSMSVLKNQHETLPIEMLGPYAKSKLICEELLRQYHENYMIIRFSTIFFAENGKDGLSSLIYSAKTKNEITLYNEGSAVRDFIALDDAVDATVEMAKQNFVGEVNIATGVQTSFAEIAQQLKMLNPKLEIKNKEVIETPVLSSFYRHIYSDLGEAIEDYYRSIA